VESELYLNRFVFTNKSTIGELSWKGGEFECNTLEDTCRRDKNLNKKLDPSEKVYGETAIPSGRYQVKMQWSARYQRKMPFLQNVPMFEGIMIHWGNFPKDTFGCILVGDHDPDSPDFVSGSQKAYNDLEPKLAKALTLGPLFINVQGGLQS
jgi:hypothetical protein